MTNLSGTAMQYLSLAGASFRGGAFVRSSFAGASLLTYFGSVDARGANFDGTDGLIAAAPAASRYQKRYQSRHLSRDIDMDMDMDGELRPGSTRTRTSGRGSGSGTA